MDKKTILILVGLFTIAFMVGLLLSAKKQQTSISNQPQPTPATIQEPLLLPPAIAEDIPFYDIEKETVLPTEINRVKTETVSAKDVAAKTAKLLGFTSQPQINKTNSNSLSWRENNSSFIMSGSPVVFSYTPKVPFSGEITEDLKTIETKTIQYVRSLNIIPPEYELKPNNPQYFAPTPNDANPVKDISQATVVQINLQAYLNGLPVYLGSAGYASAWVRWGGQDRVLGFSIYNLPKASIDSEKQKIISSDNAVLDLNSGKGTLSDMSISSPSGDMTLLQTAPRSISVKQAELGYYYKEGQLYLHPVFVLHGSGTTEGQLVDTISLLSASASD
jgi:hypothetical protein